MSDARERLIETATTEIAAHFDAIGDPRPVAVVVLDALLAYKGCRDDLIEALGGEPAYGRRNVYVFREQR